MRTFNTLLGILTLLAPCFAQEEETEKEKQDLWTIRGRAIDETGKPIEGACVAMESKQTLSSQGALDNPRARTNKEGRFEFLLPVPEGDETRRHWQTLIVAPGRASAFLNPGLLSGFFRPSLDALRIELGEVTLPPAVTLRGRVRRTNGRPLAGARVVATDAIENLTGGGTMWVASASYASVAISDEQGAFTLPGCFASGATLSIDCEGYFSRKVVIAIERDPLLIEMEESGTIEGIVLGMDGGPCAAMVIAEYEVSGPRSTAYALADGKFSLTVTAPHRYRISAILPGPGSYEKAARSPVLDGPARDIVLRFATKKVAAPLIVEVIASRTGNPIEEARATAQWIDPGIWESSRAYVESQFEGKAVSADKGGMIRLPGPSGNEPETGLIIIKARGFAPRTIEGVTWSQTKPPRLVVQLEPEATLSGVVVDRDRKPIEGAVVMVAKDLNEFTHWIALSSVAASESVGRRTNKQGEFRIGGLKAGAHQVQAYLPGTPRTATVTVVLRNGENLELRQLMIQKGNFLSGKVMGAPIGTRWQLRAAFQVPGAFNSYNPMSELDVTRSEYILPDGRFRLDGLAPGRHEVALIMPQIDGRGPNLVIPLDALKFKDRDQEWNIDLTSRMPAVIEGRIEITGAPFRPERLVVVAAHRKNLNLWGWEARDAIALVSNQGSYRLPVVAGSYALRILDLETRIVLYQSESLLDCEAAQHYRTNLHLKLSRVRITLVPEKLGGEVALSQLEVIVGHPTLDADETFLFTEQTRKTDMGVLLADGRREIILILPCLETTFKLRSEFHNLLTRVGLWEQGKPLHVQKFTPVAGTSNRLTIQVPAPQQVEKDSPPK